MKSLHSKITREGITFDDLLLIPVYSEILPTQVNTESHFSKNIKLSIPIISSAMDTVTEHQMAIAMATLGGLGIIHKNLSAEQQAKEVELVKAKKLMVGAAMGVSPAEFERAKLLVKAGVDVLVVDTAHGHSKGVGEMVKLLKKNFKKLDVVAGNVGTAEACRYLIKMGADGIKIGIGPGSICTTRIVAGVGVPQMSALLDCASVCLQAKIPFISDGGIKYSGDIVKALAAGASSVMIGSLIAGTDEATGEIIQINGEKFKAYRGMGSLGAMGLGSKDRYGQGEVKENKKLVPEGVEGAVPYKGPVSDVIHQLTGGVRAGMGYLGAKNLKALVKNAKFIKIGQASLNESHPHDILITKKAPNYE